MNEEMPVLCDPDQGKRGLTRRFGIWFLIAIVGLASGCVSERTLPRDEDLIGTYSSEVDIDSFVSIELSGDHTYTEWFVGGTVMVITAEHPVPEMPRHRQAYGRWKREGDNVLLNANNGHRRQMVLAHEDGRMLLKQRWQKGFFKFYRDPR